MSSTASRALVWRDKNFLLHDNPQPCRSKNAMVFSCQNELMALELGEEMTYSRRRQICTMIEAHQISPGVYAQAPWDMEDPASHDNTTAMVSLSYRLNLPYHKNLKILGKFWHPRDLAFYNYCKGGWRRALFGRPFLWITKLAQYSTCNDEYKVRPHGTFVDTDGKLLTVCRCLGLKKEFADTFEKCKRIISKHTDIELIRKYDDQISFIKVDISRLDKVFKWYFNEWDCHPNNELATQLWGDD